MVAMGLILSFAAGAIASLLGGMFAIVQAVIKSTNFKPGDGLKASQGLVEMFMVAGAMFGALVGLFQVVENGATLFGTNIFRNVGFMLLLAGGLVEH